MTEAERVFRFVAGIVGAPLVYTLVVRPLDGVVAAAAMVVLVIGTVDLVVSGVRGYCPVYRFISVPWSRAASPALGDEAVRDADPLAPGRTSRH